LKTRHEGTLSGDDTGQKEAIFILSKTPYEWWEKEVEESKNYDILHLPTHDVVLCKGKPHTSGRQIQAGDNCNCKNMPDMQHSMLT
jgi:hypothetical protein